MLLAVDIGNTNLTLGVFQGDLLVHGWRLSTDRSRMPDEYGLQLVGLLEHASLWTENLEGVVMASVVPPLTGRLAAALRTYLGQDPLLITPDLDTGILLRVDQPASVGADRVANAVAVRELFGGPACVVDFGTATTFDALDAEGNYLGGAIAPGIGIAADALVASTAQLPRVQLEAPPSVIGRNTVSAMQAGIVYGYAGLVEGLVARFRRELGDGMQVIATGGLAQFVADHTDVVQHVAPWLTLDGLRILWGRQH
jgi:type III pantothenate kinase